MTETTTPTVEESLAALNASKQEISARFLPPLLAALDVKLKSPEFTAVGELLGQIAALLPPGRAGTAYANTARVFPALVVQNADLVKQYPAETEA